MGRKKKLPPDDPERSARFIETATRIQADDAEERFEEAMQKIAAATKRDKAKHDDED